MNAPSTHAISPRTPAVAALLERFKTGRLIRPHSDHANILDLIHAIAHLAGARQYATLNPKAAQLAARIGHATHYIFILVDGLGLNLLDLLNRKSFLKKHCTTTLHSLFPATTAAVLTSIATGTPPAQHAVCGWWVYFPDQTLSTTILPYVERYTGMPLTQAGLSPAQAFQTPSLLPAFQHNPSSLLPARLNGSIYSTYASGGTTSYGYHTMSDAMDHVCRTIRRAAGPTYTYLYFPQVDSICHRQGTASGKVRHVLLQLDALCKRLRANLNNRTRIIISADHGLTHLPPDRIYTLHPDDPLLSRLACPPTGDGAAPIFHVKPGEEARFEAEFNGRFARDFALLSQSEAEALALFGDMSLSDPMRKRAGTFIAVALNPAILYYLPADKAPKKHAAVHAGLFPSDMLVPLILV